MECETNRELVRITIDFSFLNRDRSHEEYDVWTNHVLGEDTLTSMGITDMFEGPDGLHQRTMRWISKTYQQPFKVPLTDLKPKGKLAQDYWYARRHLKQL